MAIPTMGMRSWNGSAPWPAPGAGAGFSSSAAITAVVEFQSIRVTRVQRKIRKAPHFEGHIPTGRHARKTRHGGPGGAAPRPMPAGQRILETASPSGKLNRAELLGPVFADRLPQVGQQRL